MSLKDYLIRLSTDVKYRQGLSPESLMTEARQASRVLIIEDDLAVGPFLELRLGNWGYSAALVDNGVDGIKALEQGQADILLTDFNYPPKGGADVVKYAVRTLQFPTGRIIMFTTNTDEARGKLEGIPITLVEKPNTHGVKIALDKIVERELAKFAQAQSQ